jgi:hypothetical protein
MSGRGFMKIFLLCFVFYFPTSSLAAVKVTLQTESNFGYQQLDTLEFQSPVKIVCNGLQLEEQQLIGLKKELAEIRNPPLNQSLPCAAGTFAYELSDNTKVTRRSGCIQGLDFARVFAAFQTIKRQIAKPSL